MEQASLINTENDERSSAPSAATAHAEPQRPVRVIVSELLAGGREAILVHDGQGLPSAHHRQRQAHSHEIEDQDP
jgi:hemin uptake protein HemP